MLMFPPPPHESCDLGIVPQEPEDPQLRLTKTYIITSQEEAPAEECRTSLMSPDAFTAQRPDGKSPFVTVPQIVAGTAKYVSADMARYIAYSPRSFFQPEESQGKGPPPPTTKKRADTPRRATTSSSSETTTPSAEERLSIAAIKFDARTLNLHLSLRVQEVLACAEAMWDFVEAYQEKAGLPQGSRAPSVTSSDSSTPSRPAHHTSRNPKWKDLLALRRWGFDAMLRRFKL